MRGAATGDAALAVNPSGISLLRTYVLEAEYLYDQLSLGTQHDAHLSIVDSTSGFNVGGGVFYNYLTGMGRSGHEAGVAVSIPFGEHFFVGGTAKYLHLHNDTPSGTKSGFSFDAGATIRPLNSVTVGFSATDFGNFGTDRTPRTFGGGLAVSPLPDLILTFDAVYDRTNRVTGTDSADYRQDPPARSRVWNLMGGGEYLFAKRLAVRAGGGRRGDTESGYIAGGISLVSDVAALDLGAHGDLGASRHQELLIGVSLRIFVPAP
jgi:hypothetical protein